MRGVFSAIIAMVLAQLLKVPTKRITMGKWDLKQAFTSGGMPSSHSAVVTSLATYIGLKLGSRTLDFGLALIFGFVVMYDAQGVRRYAGETAIRVNELEKRIDQLNGENKDQTHKKIARKLQESIGHQPEEVIGGAVLGTIVGYLSFLSQGWRKN